MPYNFGQSAKVSVTRVKEFCSLPHYNSCVKRCIERGNGFVDLYEVDETVRPIMAGVTAGNPAQRALGLIWIPFDSLIF